MHTGDDMARHIAAKDIFLAVAIAASAFISDVVWAALMESFVMPRFYPPGTPRLSYGLGWGLLLVFVVVPLGAIGGASVFLARRGVFAGAAGLCLAGAALAILLLLPMWTDDVARKGYHEYTGPSP